MSPKEGLCQQHWSEVPMDIVVFILAQLYLERKSSMLCTKPETQFLSRDLVGTSLEKTEWSFIGTQMVGQKEEYQ